MARSANARHGVVVCLDHGRDDPERVALAHVLGIDALRIGWDATMWLAGDAVELGVAGVAPSILLPGGPSIEELHDEYTGRGGQYFLSATSVRLRGLADATWIRHARVEEATALLGLVRDGAVVLHA